MKNGIKKGKGLDLGAESPRITLVEYPAPGFLTYLTYLDCDSLLFPLETQYMEGTREGSHLMAENIKDLYDLYGNPDKRFKAINNSLEFSMKKTLFLINLVCSCFLCGYFPDPLRFKPRILGGKGNRLQKLRKYLLHFRRHILKSILQSN